MHTRSKQSESKEPASSPREEIIVTPENTQTTTTDMQENTETTTPETSENITQEQVEAGDSGEINPNKNDDITSMLALLIQRFDKSEGENRKSQEENRKSQEENRKNYQETKKDIRRMEENIKEQIKYQSIELREDMMRMREEDRKERETLRQKDKKEGHEEDINKRFERLIKSYPKLTQMGKNVDKEEKQLKEIEDKKQVNKEENVKKIACHTEKLETEVVSEDINKRLERLIENYPKLSQNWKTKLDIQVGKNTEKEGNKLEEMEENKQVDKEENELKNEAKEAIESIVKHETQEEKLNDPNKKKNETNNENKNEKLNVNRSEQEYEERINKEEILNEKNKKKNKHNNMEYKNIVRNKRRKILRQRNGNMRKQDDINEESRENREPISTKIIRYMNKITRKYHKNQVLIYGTRIERRTAKRKPNVLYEGPFKIKINGSL